MHDAREYVKLAEKINGAIPRRVDYDYIWGDVLAEFDRAGTDLRIVNLETSVTSSKNHWPDKAIHYRMHPPNIGCIATARIDCCCLANNHVLDWGYEGLAETLRTLDRAGVARAGAGHNAAEAASPAALDVAGKGRALVFSFGSVGSCIAVTLPAASAIWAFNTTSGSRLINNQVGEKYSSHCPTLKKSSGLIKTTT
jgi:poly-gamma-glutamate capsule biosynthesis protein CapA/YwtB (metallophosphatase superfamily)